MPLQWDWLKGYFQQKDGGKGSNSGNKQNDENNEDKKIKYKDSLEDDMSGLDDNTPGGSNFGRGMLGGTTPGGTTPDGSMSGGSTSGGNTPGVGTLGGSMPIGNGNNSKKDGKVKRLMKGAGRAGRHYTRGILNKKPIRKFSKGAVKVAAKVAVGGAGVGLGLAAGVASGDLSNAMKYSIAGGVGGYALAGNLGNKAVNAEARVKDALSVDGTAQAFYGEEAYKQKQIEKNIKEAKKDGNIKMALEDKYGYERAREIRNDILPDCVRYGLADINDIMTVAEMEGTNVGGRTVSREDAIRSVIEVNDMGKNTGKLSAKDSEDLDKTLINRARKNKKVKDDDAQAKRVAARTRELMDQASRIKYKM